MTNPQLTATVLTMREAGGTFQKIATATKRHPATVRDICLKAGMPLCLPGRSYGGKREDWIRKASAKALRRDPLPAGHRRTWGAISAQPWPGVVL